MTALPNMRMTVDEYLTWAEDQPGRYELVNGTVYAMAPETAGHARIKAAVHAALLAGIRARRLGCHVLPDGMTVRTDNMTSYEPDALIYCGAQISDSAVEVPNPVILVEVLSPSTRSVDLSFKLTGYFQLPSVAHYLIVDPTKPLIIHYARGTDETIVTRIVREGKIKLDPPGFELPLADIYDAS